MAKEKPSAAWTATCTDQACEPVGLIESARRSHQFSWSVQVQNT
jgi:hypothetical protein